jgi:hypothetical protein
MLMVSLVPESVLGRSSRGVTISPGDDVCFEDMVFIINVLAVALTTGFFLAKVITA